MKQRLSRFTLLTLQKEESLFGNSNTGRKKKICGKAKNKPKRDIESRMKEIWNPTWKKKRRKVLSAEHCAMLILFIYSGSWYERDGVQAHQSYLDEIEIQTHDQSKICKILTETDHMLAKDAFFSATNIFCCYSLNTKYK